MADWFSLVWISAGSVYAFTMELERLLVTRQTNWSKPAVHLAGSLVGYQNKHGYLERSMFNINFMV